MKSSPGDAAQLAVTPAGPQIKPPQLADGGRRGESGLKRRGEPRSGRVGGKGGVGMTRESEELNTWKARSQQAPLANIPRISTRARAEEPVYYGTALGAAVSHVKVTWPRGEPRNYYFIVSKRNLQGQYENSANLSQIFGLSNNKTSHRSHRATLICLSS